jgi:hypothetical protein
LLLRSGNFQQFRRSGAHPTEIHIAWGMHSPRSASCRGPTRRFLVQERDDARGQIGPAAGQHIVLGKQLVDDEFTLRTSG